MGSWEGKNQRKSTAGAMFLSFRVGAGKGGVERLGGEKSMP